jgi:hypothetical protein
MMNDDSRYPNRPRPIGESPSFDFEGNESKPVTLHSISGGTDQQYPGSEKADEENLPHNSYKVIEPGQESPPVEFVAELPPPVFAGTGVDIKNADETPPAPEPPAAKPLTESIRNFIKNPTKIYITASVALGVLLGIFIATFLWHADKPMGPYDLGTSAAKGTGLQGHLFTRWEKKLEYRLTIEPADADLQAGFSLAVAHSPRPLSIAIHLQDDRGFVLCNKEILLRFDANNAIGQAVSFSAEQEAAREKNQDLFLNQIGPDGTIAAIYAQGDMQDCSMRDYGKTFTWSITPDFPSIAEQKDLLNRSTQQLANAARQAGAGHVIRQKKTPDAVVNLLPFSVEGDDAIVEFDGYRGKIVTEAGKTFFFDKTSGAGSDSRWQDYPVSIHYRCDRASNCVIKHEGILMLHAVMKR